MFSWHTARKVEEEQAYALVFHEEGVFLGGYNITQHLRRELKRCAV
jgi:hypothetical protein